MDPEGVTARLDCGSLFGVTFSTFPLAVPGITLRGGFFVWRGMLPTAISVRPAGLVRLGNGRTQGPQGSARRPLALDTEGHAGAPARHRGALVCHVLAALPTVGAIRPVKGPCAVVARCWAHPGGVWQAVKVQLAPLVQSGQRGRRTTSRVQPGAVRSLWDRDLQEQQSLIF